MGTRISNFAVFVLGIVCAALLPGRLLAQGQGSRTVQLQPTAEGEEERATEKAEPSTLTPKAQKSLDNAFKLLGPNMPAQEAHLARRYLETAYKIAPTSADVNYLFGVYSWQTSDRQRAMSYWMKAIEFYPKHYRALLSLGQALVDEIRLGEAQPYLERAAQAEPFSWRPYALSAHVYLRQGLADKAAKHAERALELGGGEAAVAQRYLAAALAMLGEPDKAVSILQSYVRGHHTDTGANKQLEKLQVSLGRNGQDTVEASSEELLQSAAIAAVTPVPLPTTRWLPPDVDEKVPPVEPGAACVVDNVVQEAGKRVQEFVKNVDRYTASELLAHESIDQWGFAASPEKRKFDYLVSIKEMQAKLFDVQEYRRSGSGLDDFSDGLQSNGLPALVLVFHPYNVENFDLTCEGLARRNGGMAWQVHFRQKDDRPNSLRAYKIGISGPSYPVSLKGRAWIAADSYQVVRLETNLVRPVPEIRLAAEHTVIEYGPVSFRERNVDMWLPQSAEVYSDWKGRRFHLHHNFSKYLLFSVDDKQTISAPKAAEEAAPKSPSADVKQIP